MDDNPLLVEEPLHVPIHVANNLIVVENPLPVPVLDTKLDTAHDIDIGNGSRISVRFLH